MDLNGLISDIQKEIQKYDAIQKERGNQYNLFKVIHMTSNETSVHSAFIADLLNPKGLHGMGSIFLKLFIECLPPESKRNLKSFDADHASVKVEYYIGQKTETHGGRIDIIIFSKGQSIIIENKIYAIDQENQMIRYYNYAEEHFKNKYTLLYLSLDGEVHDENVTAKSKNLQIKTNEQFFTISYKNIILNWLTLCRNKVLPNPLIDSAILHYINLIKILTKKEDMRNEEVKSIANAFIKDPEIIQNLDKIEDAIRQSKIELQRKFWYQLISHIRSNLAIRDYPMSLFSEDGTTNTNSLDTEIDQRVENYVLKGKGREEFKQFGISLIIGGINEYVLRFNIVLNIAISFQVSIEKDGNRLLNQEENIPEIFKSIRNRELPQGWSKEKYRLWGLYPKSLTKPLYLGNMSKFEYTALSKLPETVELILSDMQEEINNLRKLIGLN